MTLQACHEIIENRIELGDNGNLNEVVTDGGAHLERLDKRSWFLNCVRADGSSFAMWFQGNITMTEERQAPDAFKLASSVPLEEPFQ